ITAPRASRHSVAVSSRLYSRGSFGLARAATRISKLGSSRRHQLLERPPAGLVVLELVEGRTGGREQHDLAGPRGAGRRLERALERPPALPADDCAQALGLLPDEVDAGAALGHRRAQRRVVLALALAAEDEADRRVEALERHQRRGDVGRLGVVDEEHVVDPRDLLEAVLDAAEAPQ